MRVAVNARRRCEWIETLESRTMLSVSAMPLDSVAPLTGTSVSSPFTPAEIRAAYGFDQISFSTPSGTVTGDGTGQTIAIVDAYADPNIAGDLHAFDTQFGLADPTLSVVNQTGGTTNLPATDAGWAIEIALDVEWAHVAAPGANLVLVEAKSAGVNDLLASVNTARNIAGVSVVSMSWGSSEFSSERSYDSYFTTPIGHRGVTFVASSGDNGSNNGPLWPSVSPNVMSVGGTKLTILGSNGVYSYGTETGWTNSGGGTSRYESEPSYQLKAIGGGKRSSPDVAYNADPNTGVFVYDSVPYQGSSGWWRVGGTSAGSPQWAGLMAVADQGRTLQGSGTLDGGTGALPALYSLYNSSSNYGANFNDILTGSSSRKISAKKGYDQVTGLGSPKSPSVVQTLVAATSGSITGQTTVAMPAGNGASIKTGMIAQASGAVSPTQSLFSNQAIQDFDSSLFS